MWALRDLPPRLARGARLPRSAAALAEQIPPPLWFYDASTYLREAGAAPWCGTGAWGLSCSQQEQSLEEQTARAALSTVLLCGRQITPQD